MTFLVRWTGYSSEDDTWEPWSHVNETAAIERYAFDNGIRLPPETGQKWDQISLAEIVGMASSAEIFDLAGEARIVN
jgi:hypothetical protein